ncbi:uncharacterized protein LOC125374395 [Haliotis rufescens]|uniref:uncharacterized protein LOC125374395 n=1 Tax=Haliotis rufescens TaxID=6454 RepID=UPI00201FA3C2|nr:uncharacterized protein LOC125374395 [Haliotis rufescens]
MLRSEDGAKVNIEAMKKTLGHMDDYLMQCFRQRHAEFDCETCEDPDPATTGNHATVIKKLSPVLTNDLRLEGTHILDRLLQEDVLSEAGRSSILTHPSTHAKNAAFLKFCNGCTSSQFTATIVPALKACNDEVNTQLACEIERELSLLPQIVHDSKRSLCKFCSIRSRVNLRRLADVMYQMNAISDQQREDLSSPYLSHDKKRKQLVKKTKQFALSLKKKYPELYQDVRWTPFSALCCSCEDVSTTVNTHEETDNESRAHIARLSDVESDLENTEIHAKQFSSDLLKQTGETLWQVGKIHYCISLSGCNARWNTQSPVWSLGFTKSQLTQSVMVSYFR